MTAHAPPSPALDWFAAHAATLETARATIRTRGYWSAYPEVPSAKIYGETAKSDGQAAFAAYLGKPFGHDGSAPVAMLAPERSPYGIALEISYPAYDVQTLVSRATAALPAWSEAGVDARAGVLLEALARLNARSFELAYATMFTTGQPFVMAFQAGGPHAQDRALEALAYAYDEMTRVPRHVVWEKPQGKAAPLRVEKTFAIVPRGIALTLGCSTFPNWNAYPGLFASLATGNVAIVKPHPQAVLPLAISVEILRDTLCAAGFDPNVVTLAVDTLQAPLAQALVARPEIAIVDYTGSPGFGTWLEANATARVYTEKAGVNSVVIDGTGDCAGMLRNLALSVCLYSGQMCTTPQNVFIPRTGIMTADGPMSFDDVVSGLVDAIDSLLATPERAVDVLGAIASDATLARIDGEAKKPGVVRASAALAHPQYPAARIRTPLVIVVDAAQTERYGAEMFGPIVYAVATDSTAASFELATASARAAGAIVAVLYAVDPAVIEAGRQAAMRATVSLAINLTGSLLVNQSSAYSDFHVSGGNPAGNASLTDAAFVADRFRIVETRRPIA